MDTQRDEWRHETHCRDLWFGFWVKRANFSPTALVSGDLQALTENRRGPKSTASLRHMETHSQSCSRGKLLLPFRIFELSTSQRITPKKNPANSIHQAI